MVDGEPLAGPAKTGHHLVTDHQDAVAVAELPHPLEVSVRRNQDAIRPGDRLQDEARNGRGALELNRLFQVA